MSVIGRFSAYTLERLSKDPQFMLYRAREPKSLLFAPASEKLPQNILMRVEHEYRLRAQLDPAWAVMPIALARDAGRMILGREDPGGEPLDRVLEKGSLRSSSKLIRRRFRRAIGQLLIGLICSLTLIFVAVPARGEDWGMGAANRQIAGGAVFSPVSTPASSIATLAWFILAVTAAIFLAVFGLLVYSVVRFRARGTDEPREPAQLYGSNQIEFAWTTIPVLIVFVLVLTTIRTIYDVQAAREPPGAVHVRVIGHQWWWEFQYPDLGIVTANELHVPLSDPAHPTPTWLRLESADVAHSFWVPRLAGKTDLIPNRINTMWIAPHQAGTYLGQCAEFCGTEHAMMLIRVVVEPRPVFDQWVAAQRLPAVSQSVQARGQQVFESNACVSCHSVRGIPAHGTYGPDLTHLMSRRTIGSGVALNTPEHLKIWVGDPGRMKPGVLMPAMNLSESDLDDLVAWMVTLK